MEPTVRPNRRLRDATVLVAALLIVCIVVAMVATGRLDARFHHELADLEQTVAGRAVADRPPTFGPSDEAAAWPAYERARLAMNDGDAMIAALLDGGRATRVGRPAVRERGDEAYGVEAVEIGSKAMAIAREAFARGETARALAIVTATLRFARDLAATGPWIDAACGVHIADGATVVLAEVTSAATEPDGTIADIATFVAAIEASWPTARAVYDQEVLGSGLLLARFVAGNHSVFEVGGPLQLWRFGFSKSRFVTAWWDLAAERRGALDVIEGQDWPTAERALLAPPFARTGGPLDLIGISLGGPLANERAMRARLRILVAALEFRRDGTIPEFVDPFDRLPLRARIDGERATIWSVGANGRDDGGLGSLDSADDVDIALTISRDP